MDIQVTVAIIGVAAALFGSAIGGLSSYFSTRSMRKLEWKLSQVDREMEKREALYADFLSHSNIAMVSAFSDEPRSTDVIKPLVNLESRIRLISPEVGELARKIVSCVIDHHQESKKEKANYPALRDEFITKCKTSLDALRADV